MGTENQLLAKSRLAQQSFVKPVYNHVMQTPFTEDQALNLTLKLLFAIKAHQAPLQTTQHS